MFVLLGTRIEDKLHVFVSNGSFIIWQLWQGLDNLDSPELLPLSRGSWESFEDGDLEEWRTLCPEKLETLLCQIDPAHLERLDYQQWAWLRFPLVALVTGDGWLNQGLEFIPVTIFEPAESAEAEEDSNAQD